MDKSILALQIMANKVQADGNCVLELIIGDNGMLAHLIPLDAWENDFEDDEDE
jgi:hypothetical protein